MHVVYKLYRLGHMVDAINRNTLHKHAKASNASLVGEPFKSKKRLTKIAAIVHLKVKSRTVLV